MQRYMRDLSPKSPGPSYGIDPNARLKIITLEPKGSDHISITAQFNPKEVQQDATVPWESKNKDLEYVKSAPESLSFEMMFDGFETNDSVVPQIQALLKLTKPMNETGDLARPPKVRIIWGPSTDSYNLPPFTGVVESVSIKYQMFSADGQVLRATANVKLKESALKPAGKK